MKALTAYTIISILLLASIVGTRLPAHAFGRETYVPEIQFQPIRPTRPLTIREAVGVSLRNFPIISNKLYKLRAAKANVTLAKTQYLPNLNVDFQESGVTPNRIASVVMNNVSGFDTVPVDSGPPATKFNFTPICNSLQGLNLNWLVVDFGLRHANDQFAYADARIAKADLNLTKLDVAFDAADSFLTAVATKQIIRAAQANLDHMEAANLRTKVLVSKGLRPGIEAANWDFEVSRAKITLIKAQKEARLALIDLAERMGIANQDIDVVSEPLIHPPIEMEGQQMGKFDLKSHPYVLLKAAEIERWKAKIKLLDVAYRPHLWLNSSVWGRGSGENSVNPLRSVAGGFLPQTFDYMVGGSLSFPVMEIFPLRAQKKIAYSHQMAARADFDLAIQILERKDARARVLLAEARRVAKETPMLVDAAKVREIKELKRYSTGLTNMVTVAEAEKALAQAQVEDALAQLEVWRSILALSYAQGDLRTFLNLVSIAEGNTDRQTN